MIKTFDDKSLSPWTIFERWLTSDDKQPVPSSVVESKKVIQTVILYRFQYSPYIIYLNNMFNNYSLYQMPVEDVYKLTKQCVKLSGFKSAYVSKEGSEIDNTKFLKLLKRKFYYLKDYEVSLLIKYIDISDDKDAIYESFGLYTSKKTKTTSDEKKKLDKIIKQIPKHYSLKQLMEKFQNV
jgi:hypothetical protein